MRVHNPADRKDKKNVEHRIVLNNEEDSNKTFLQFIVLITLSVGRFLTILVSATIFI